MRKPENKRKSGVKANMGKVRDRSDLLIPSTYSHREIKSKTILTQNAYQKVLSRLGMPFRNIMGTKMISEYKHHAHVTTIESKV
jgi:hypothetical protein